MTDPCEDICDAIVAYLNALVDEDPNPFDPFNFEASKPADPNAELDAGTESLRILLWPHGETETKIGRGGQVLETFMVAMLVVQSLSTTVNRQILSTLCRTVKAQLRGVRMAGFVYSTAETTKADLEQLHENKRFASATILSYTGTA
jgi:hypothetical protein